MARGRMLDRRFMESKKLNTVPRDARLAYASILPFLDREGRIIAEPIYLKAMVFRHSDFTIDEVGTAVQQLADVGLVLLYADEDNAAIIEYVDFKRFNSPNAKESKSDLPGPDDEGSVPCREPLVTAAPAPHVQRTGTASGERNVNGTRTSTINENVNPPYPPALHQPEPTTPEDGEDDEGRTVIDEALNAVDRRRARNYSTGLLAQQHPEAHAALQDLQSVYAFKPPQYAIYAERLLELARDHGSGTVAAACEAILLSGDRIRNPMTYLRKILENHAAEVARVGPTSATPDFKGDLDRLFGAN